MFDLTESDLQQNILDCGSGPASFNAEMTQLGHTVISCDPIYQFSTEQIQQQIDETYDVIVTKVKATQENFVWTNFRSPEDMAHSRMTSMQKFFSSSLCASGLIFLSTESFLRGEEDWRECHIHSLSSKASSKFDRSIGAALFGLPCKSLMMGLC